MLLIAGGATWMGIHLDLARPVVSYICAQHKECSAFYLTQHKYYTTQSEMWKRRTENKDINGMLV